MSRKITRNSLGNDAAIRVDAQVANFVKHGTLDVVVYTSVIVAAARLLALRSLSDQGSNLEDLMDDFDHRVVADVESLKQQKAEYELRLATEQAKERGYDA